MIYYALSNQNIYDVCLMTYKTFNLLNKLIEDNIANYGVQNPNVDSVISVGQPFYWDNSISINPNVNQFLSNNNLNIATYKELTSYANLGGTGNRSSIIAVTQFDSGTTFLHYDATVLVNGYKGGDGGYMNGAVAGCWIKFDFAKPRLIQEAKLYLETSVSTLGIWTWQGSNDNIIWNSIGAEFTLGIAGPLHPIQVQTQTSLSSNANCYRYYRLVGISGDAGAGPYVSEMEFKINVA